MQQKVTAQIGATPISIETGKIARLADGAVVVTCGDTMVLASAVSATQIKEGQDWFPLTVDYREKAAAVGKFPGGYFKREGRPSEKETLTSRMTDRRLFPQVELREQVFIPVGLRLAQIIEQAPAHRHHLEEAAARRMVFGMALEVFR